MFGRSSKSDAVEVKPASERGDGESAIEFANDSEVVVYQPDSLTKIEARIVNDTIWLSQKQIADLFMTSKQDVSYHISNAIKEELRGFEVVKDFLTTAEDGKCYTVKHYNLDAILSVGYRIKSPRGIQFRQWANGVLKIQLPDRAVGGFRPSGSSAWREVRAMHLRPYQRGRTVRVPRRKADQDRVPFRERRRDFCSLHVNAISGKRTFASYVTPGYQVC